MNLKPCPFCNGTPATYYWIEEGYSTKFAHVKIYCKACSAGIERIKPYFESGNTNPGLSFMDAEKDAMEAWSRRGQE